MRIGMKYCSGCRPGKGSEYYNKFLTYIMNHGGEWISGRTEYDYLILFCGCGSKCTSIDGIVVKKEAIWVDRNLSKEQYEEMIWKISKE